VKDWLHKWLGFTAKVESLEAQLEAWRSRAIAAEANVELLREMMKERRPTELGSSREQKEAPSFEPIRPQFGSWPRMRRKLEEMERVKPNAQVSRGEVEKTIRG
jgi:hypothetical protein